jgi:sulfite exporter TauE/SafE
MLMFGFGLGTLPMLLTMGRTYDFLRTFVRNPLTRRLAGVAVILLGAYTSFTAISGSGHHHSTGDGQQMQHHQS